MNVLRARQELGLTQEELAARAALSTRYIGAIERATVSISITVLAQVATALNLEPAHLLRDQQRIKTEKLMFPHFATYPGAQSQICLPGPDRTDPAR
ncbi:MAG TPA: helix-turn-helix transcriptional regulator [Acidocella sp.]|nr:helix-turn-helix transcriptional regulator [Acidocella sp.]